MKRSVYVETHAGWRAFFLGLLLAAIFGFGFRLVFSPARLKTWVTTALDRQKSATAHPFAVSIGDVSLRLADASGLWPQLAVVLRDVKIAPSPECHPEASVFIGELRLPFRVIDLLQGRAAVGIIGAKDLVIDLDGLRAKCASPNANVNVQTSTSTSTSTSNVSPWWSPQAFDSVHSFIEGVEFSRATLQFERKTKEVYLDSVSASLNGNQEVVLRTDVRIPPQVSYGEQLPALKIEGRSTSTKADLVVQARVSEGSMTTVATLTPGAHEQVQLTAALSVKSLPLSVLSPLLKKSGLANAKFQPKFLWLDCEARVQGPFQRLLQKSPLKIQDCRISGDGTDLQISEATRLPTGVWQPFNVKVQSLSLAKLFETAGVKGSEGVANDFGELLGSVHVESDHVADFKGQLRNVQLLFSNRKVRAPQIVRSADLEIKIGTEKVGARLGHVDLLNGSFEGEASLELNRALSTGSLQADISKLVFDPTVQLVLVEGSLGPIEGWLRAKVEDSNVKDFDARAKLSQTVGADFEFAKLEVAAGRKGEEPPRVVIDLPSLLLKGRLRSAVTPAFYGHALTALTLEQPHIEMAILGEGDVEWAKARATLERGQIVATSNGTMNRDHTVTGSLKLDYPKIKNLKWSMRGPLDALLLRDDSEELLKLKQRAEVDDTVLGIK